MTVAKQKSSIENYSVTPSRDFRFAERPESAPLRVLSEEDWKCWKENGYVVVPNAVPKKNLEAVIDLIWEFQEMNRDDPDTWYRNPANPMQMKELINSGMVEVYNAQALWDTRQSSRVYEAFVDIWGSEKLWVSIDRVNLNVPVRPGWEFKGFIHWDVDTSLDPLPVNVQGVLSLNDSTEEMGGFQCIPEIFRNFDECIKRQPPDRDPWMPNIEGCTVEKIVNKSGDLLIWNSLLPHGLRPNRTNKPRMAQYISMAPAQEDNQELVEWRIRSWRERIAPKGYAFPGDPRAWEQKFAKTAKLTPLGEKLLGLRRW